MKNINRYIYESKINDYDIEIIVAKDAEAKSYNTYNLNGINNAIKDALNLHWDLFYKITKDGKTFISQSLQEAINKVK